MSQTLIQGTQTDQETFPWIRTSDVFSDFVVSGLTGTVPASSLSMTITAGSAYVNGYHTVVLSTEPTLTYTYTASTDTYVDLLHTDTLVYTAVANGVAAPAITANSIRLMKVVTDATVITTVTNLATTVPAQNRKTIVRAHVSASQAITAATATLINFDTVDIDALNEFNITTYTFTALHSGTYRVTASVGGTAATAGDRQISFYHNATPILLNYSAAATGNTNVQGSDIIALTASDTITIYYTNAVADNTSTDSGLTKLIIERID